MSEVEINSYRFGTGKELTDEMLAQIPIAKNISRYNKSIQNCKTISSIIDRLYVYDNSIDDVNASPLFRLSDGQLVKQYTSDIPEWALTLI